MLQGRWLWQISSHQDHERKYELGAWCSLNEAPEFLIDWMDSDGSHMITSGCSEVSSCTFYISAFSAGSSSPCLGFFLVDV